MRVHLLLLLGVTIILGGSSNARAVLGQPSIASTNNDLAKTPRILRRRDGKPSPEDRFERARIIRLIKADQGPKLARASKAIDEAREHLESNPDLSPEEAQRIRLGAFGTYVDAMAGVFDATDSRLNPKLAGFVRTGLLDDFKWPHALHEPIG
jgi:glycine/D-amino acid oxidase-like deaminating enzyme